MGSIFICTNSNSDEPRLLELVAENLTEKDLERVRQGWPQDLSGVFFEEPKDYFKQESKVTYQKESNPPRVANYLSSLADKLSSLGKPSTAFKLYDLSYAVRPNAETILSKAKVLFSQGQVQGALEQLDRFLIKEPNSPQGLYLRGRLYLSLDEYEKAKTSFKMAIVHVRNQNVEDRRVEEAARTYLEFTSLILARDTLHTYDYTDQQYQKAIKILLARSIKLKELVQKTRNQEVKGMEFTLETLCKTFDRWHDEFARRMEANDKTNS